MDGRVAFVLAPRRQTSVLQVIQACLVACVCVWCVCARRHRDSDTYVRRRRQIDGQELYNDVLNVRMRMHLVAKAAATAADVMVRFVCCAECVVCDRHLLTYIQSPLRRLAAR